MALTGLVMFGFVIGHMIGNLQVFLGPEAINLYGAMLHAWPELLWIVRSVLLTALVLHVVFSLWVRIIEGGMELAKSTAGRTKRGRQFSRLRSGLPRLPSVSELINRDDDAPFFLLQSLRFHQPKLTSVTPNLL